MRFNMNNQDPIALPKGMVLGNYDLLKLQEIIKKRGFNPQSYDFGWNYIKILQDEKWIEFELVEVTD